MAQRVCQYEHCGAAFEAKRGTAKYCGSSCRGKAAKARRGSGEASQGPRSMLAPLGELGPVASATKVELEAAGQLQSSLGQQALALACWLDLPGCTSPASVSKELRQVMAGLTKGTQRKSSPDQVRDEVAERRRMHGA